MIERDGELAIPVEQLALFLDGTCTSLKSCKLSDRFEPTERSIHRLSGLRSHEAPFHFIADNERC